MQLTPRKRETLRRVIEEYGATGQPVGSRVLVERFGVSASPRRPSEVSSPGSRRSGW